MRDDTADVRRQFEQAFGAGGRIRVIRAPGRVNLIGEHTDYNDGFVFPMAIESEVRVVCRGRDDATIRLASTLYPGEAVAFSLRQPITPGPPAWANYCRGIAAQMMAAGIPLVGMDSLISSTLPVGGGLSSSAAVGVATGQSLLTLAGVDMSRSRLALLAQKAEHAYAGVPVGIMDPTIVAAGRAGHAMLLDCRDLSTRFVAIDEREVKVVVVNSGVRHDLADGEYASRRRQCEEGVTHFKRDNPEVRALRDVSIAQVHAARGKLSDVVFRRCRHVVTENARVTEAAAKLEQRHYEEVGELMQESHDSLRHDYEVSVPELDHLVEHAVQVKGVYGARMTGGGFGGCVVALAQPRAVEPLRERLTRGYSDRFGKNLALFVTTATAGVSVLE